MRSVILAAAILVASVAYAEEDRGQYYNPDWSPDGKAIAFESTRDGTFAIYTIRPDGTGLRRLTNGGIDDEQPRWSRDGRRIVFVSGRDGHLQVYVMRADGSGQRRVTNGAPIDYDPSFSPDGKKVVFMTRPEAKGGNHTLATIGADGSGRRPLTDGSANDISPAWSPDGKWIVFVRAPLMTKSYRELSDAERAALRNGREIYLIRADGSGLRQLTHNEVADGAPFWSADSRRVYFVSGEGVHSIGVDGTGSAFVAPTGEVWSCAISRDGKRLAYSKQVDGKWGIYVYDLTTRQERRLIGA